MSKKNSYEITEKYNKKYIENILKSFNKDGIIVAAGERNIIKKFIFNDNKITKILNIKKFKKKNKLISFFYKYFLESKAKRSFKYAKKLLSMEINTPEPIAYFDDFYMEDEKKARSFYICENIEYDFTCREVFWDDYKPDNIKKEIEKNLEELIKEFAKYTFALHKNGVKFDDYSPGNVLIIKQKNKSDKEKNIKYKYYLIDLNRMKFLDNMNFELRMKNVSKMLYNKEHIKIFSNEYAKYYKEKTSDKIYQKLCFYVEKHRKINNINHIRRKIKKIFIKKK